jgi:hypothetical protein
MKDENRKMRITPRARALYAQLKAATDEREIVALSCALHGAVGLFPWSDISVSEVVEYLDTMQELAP